MDQLLEKIPAIPIPVVDEKRRQRQRQLQDELLIVRKQFEGKPEVCYSCAELIVKIRRSIDLDNSLKMFFELLNNYPDIIIKNTNVRWLISISDTLIDHSENPTQCAVAMNISQFVTQLNVHHSLLLNCVDGRLVDNKLRTEIKTDTWGGMITMDFPNGDTLKNMLERIRDVVKLDPLCEKLWNEIELRAKSEPNIVLNAIAKVINKPYFI